MSTTTTPLPARAEQYFYQHQVEALLGQIRAGVQELHRLTAYGVRGPALADRKQELARRRRQLADLVGRQLAPSR